MALQTASLMAWTSRQLGALANLPLSTPLGFCMQEQSGVKAWLKGRRPAAWPIALQ